MKLKLAFEPGGGRPAVDLLVTVDPDATVGAVADHLAHADPQHTELPSSPLTLALNAGGRTEVPPDVRLAESGIRSGARVSLVTAAGRFAGAAPVDTAAVIVVTGGPDEGRDFPLPAGTSVIGRDRTCEVHLTDPLVSRFHAKVHVAETVELVDMGSANGLLVGNDLSDRVVLRPGDTVKVGDSTLGIRMSATSGRHTLQPSSVGFNRPPRVDRRYEGAALKAPAPPDPPPSQRFPILPLFAPLLIGVVLYLSTKSLASLLFVGMSPLLIVANVAEGRLSGKKSYQAALDLFRADVEDLVRDGSACQEEERVQRLIEHPSTEEGAAAAAGLSPLLWSRWPDLPGFAELRLGLGTQPARNQIEMPTGKENNRPLWRELREAIAPFSTVGPVPVVARLADGGAIGIGGRRDAALGVARSLMLQAVCLHSPAELVVVGLASSRSGPDWDWLKWLPHCLSPQSPLSGPATVSTDAGCGALLAELEQLVRSRSGEDQPDVSQPSVLVLVEDDAPLDRSRAAGLATDGPQAGVYVVWVAADPVLLPAACRTFVEVLGSDGRGSAGFVRTADVVSPLELEPIPLAQAERTARQLSAVVDISAHDDAQADLPRNVSLLTLVGTDLATAPSSVIDRWIESGSLLNGPPTAAGARRRAGTLRAVVGTSAGGPHVLDLRAHGPHALVGGTTGSGKSELLQSWILGMALSNSPQRVTFLLVDYKGGSAFSACTDLPHTIGLVTDLSPHLVRRALTSLSAELKYREELLHSKGAKDLPELERLGDADAPPSLVIVVDEFAALVQEVPEFVNGVVDIAQRGRSLGLHLILATQRPAGVIKDNLRANTNLRLALRVADDADSIDVLGSPEAASFDAAIPGRAVSRTGPGQLVPFQGAYVGGWTSDTPPPPSIEMETLGFTPVVTWEVPDDPQAISDETSTDIQRIVENIEAACAQASIPDPRLPWLPELPSVCELATLATPRKDDQLVFGLADDPDRQTQPPVAFFPDRDGNLAIFGTGNSGKSTLLRTLAVAAGYTVRGGPCHVYGLDFGSRGLQVLEELPHVGSIVAGSDQERVVRLLSMLRATIDERANRYATAHAATITDYRRRSGHKEEPRILLLVDGMGAFRSAYESIDQGRWLDTFVGIAGDGRPVGVHVVVAADRTNALPASLSSLVQRRVVLRLADTMEYGVLGIPVDVLVNPPPGRGVVDELEFQVAVLSESADFAKQAAAIRGFAKSMRKAGTIEAPPIRRLEPEIALSELPASVDSGPALGMAGDTLAPIGFPSSGTFVVAGPPGSGRTTTLATMAESLGRWRPDIRLIYIGNQRSPLSTSAPWELTALSPVEAAELAQKLPDLAGDSSDGEKLCALFIESLPEFQNTEADFPLQDAISKLARGNHLVIAEGEVSAIGASYPLPMLVRNGRSGLVLQPDQLDGNLLRSQFPRTRKADFPVGRGLLVVRGGNPRVVQVGLR